MPVCFTDGRNKYKGDLVKRNLIKWILESIFTVHKYKLSILEAAVYKKKMFNVRTHNDPVSHHL